MRLAKRNGKRLLALTLALLLCAALLPTAALAETYSGTTVRLEKTEGTVTVKNAAGEVKSLSGRPRLSGGWTVKTEAASYAWLSFDADSGNTLSVKLDANTLVEVRKNGGKNEVLLKNNGRLIAGSEKPLSGGQTLSVGNSSGVCGVRGSLMLATEDQFMFLFGHGVASGRYGSAQQTELAAGQGVFFGAGGSMRRFEVQTAQISGFAQVELAGNPVLTQQMYEQTNGRLDFRELTMEQAQQQQRADEANAALLRGGSTAGGLSVPGGSRLRVDPAWGVGGRFNIITTVYFVANGGMGYMAPVTVTGAFQVPACEFTRDGYTFVGWKDDHGTDHSVGSHIQLGASGTFGEQLTLYAQWQANNPGGGNVLPYVPEPQPVPTKYAVTISDGIEHGTVSADKSEAAAGETVTLTATPDGGYLLDGLTVTGASGAVAVSDNKFTMPAEAVAVSATFTQITYPISVASGITGGTVTADKDTAAAGETVALTVTPDEGYLLDGLTVTGASGAVAVSDNEFTMPAEAVAVSATFTKRILVENVAFVLAESGALPIRISNAEPETVYGDLTLSYAEDSGVYTVSSEKKEITFNHDTKLTVSNLAGEFSALSPAEDGSAFSFRFTLGYQVNVTVTKNDDAKTPIKNANVTLTRKATGEMVSGKTNEQGTAVFTVECDEYDWQVTATGFKPLRNDANDSIKLTEIDLGTPQAVELTLTPETYGIDVTVQPDGTGEPLGTATILVNGNSVGAAASPTACMGDTITVNVIGKNNYCAKSLTISYTDPENKEKTVTQTIALKARALNEGDVVSTFEFAMPPADMTATVTMTGLVDVRILGSTHLSAGPNLEVSLEKNGTPFATYGPAVPEDGYYSFTFYAGTEETIFFRQSMPSGSEEVTFNVTALEEQGVQLEQDEDGWYKLTFPDYSGEGDVTLYSWCQPEHKLTIEKNKGEYWLSITLGEIVIVNQAVDADTHEVMVPQGATVSVDGASRFFIENAKLDGSQLSPEIGDKFIFEMSDKEETLLALELDELD